MTSMTQKIGDWFRAGARRAEIDRLDPAEAARVAGEIGMTVGELNDMAGRGPGAAEPLRRRLRALHLDPAAVAREEPAVMRDMQRVCACCGARGRCERDLASDPDGSDWQSYCPNAQTIRTL